MDREPILILVDIVKDLIVDIPIYKEVMDEDANSTPKSYIVLKSDIVDSGSVYGDGQTQVRESDCDIVLVSKGYANDTTDLHNVNLRKIKTHLKEKGIKYYGTNLGYDKTLLSTQYTFSVTVRYYG